MFPCAAAHTADCLIKHSDTNQWTQCSIILREKLTNFQLLNKHQPPHYASNYKIFPYESQFLFWLYCPQLVNPRHRQNDADRAAICCVYKTLTDGPDSRRERCVHCCCGRELVKPAMTLCSGIASTGTNVNVKNLIQGKMCFSICSTSAWNTLLSF